MPGVAVAASSDRILVASSKPSKAKGRISMPVDLVQRQVRGSREPINGRGSSFGPKIDYRVYEMDSRASRSI
jgi:hypothetical protein